MADQLPLFGNAGLTMTLEGFGRELRVGYRGVTNLAKAGLLGAKPIQRDRLSRLAAIPRVDASHLPITVWVAVQPAAYSIEEQRYVGWKVGLSPDEEDAAIGRWWNVNRRVTAMVGSLDVAFIATIAGFVVAVRSVESIADQRGDLLSFDLSDPTPRMQAAYHGRRLPAVRGPVVRVIPPIPAWPGA